MAPTLWKKKSYWIGSHNEMNSPLVPERGQEDNSAFNWEDTMKSKRILSLIVCFALVLFTFVPARSVGAVIAEGNFDYQITDAGAEVIHFYNSGDSRIVIPDTVQDYQVVSIGAEVFRNVDGITEIVLPQSLQTIGDRAFYACSDLVNILLPQSLISIGEMAFCNCYAMESLLIPANVQRIGMSAFSNCTSLKDLQVAAENSNFVAVDSVLFSADMSVLLAYPNAKPDESYRIPEQVKIIGEKAFQECGNLRSVELPADLIEIEKYAFSGCATLAAVEIPDSVQQIGTFAFSNCSDLTAVKIGQGITAIPAYAFNNCSNLQSVTLSSQLQTIGSRAFARCGTLDGISIPDSLSQIAEDAFLQTNITNVRFYSTSQKNIFSEFFLQSQILCRCQGEHTYLEGDLVNCAVCDYSLDVTSPPALQSVSYDSVQLVTHPSYEYSYDMTLWRQDGLFVNLTPNMTYNFYARIRGNQTGHISQPLTVTTDRAPQAKAPIPEILGADTTSITLKTVSGCEYSRDGSTWQSSPIFTGLTVNTQYTFYQRYAQTQTHYAGAASDSITAKTKGAVAVTSTIYTVQQNIIRKIPIGTTAETLLKGLEGGEYCTVYKGLTKVDGKSVVGTGMTVQLKSGDTVTATYTLVVTGDTNGDGDATITDMIAVKAHVLNKTLLTGVNAQAADTNGDNGVSLTDFLQIKAKILGKGSITAR